MLLRDRVAWILRAGTTRLADPRTARRLNVNNGLALALFVSGLGYAGMLAALGFAAPAALLVPVSALHVVAIGLNARGHRSAAKLLVLAVANTTIFGYLVYFGLRAEVSVFFATVSLPLILADLKERRLIAFGLALPIVYAAILATASDWLIATPRLSPAVEHGVRVSLMLMTFAMMLVAILSFVVSNARAEQKLDRARAGLQRLLDSVDQGFVTLDRAGQIGAERSSRFDAWFAAPQAGTAFSACLAGLDARVGEAFALGWSQIEEGLLPIEVAVAQLPAALEARGRHLRLAYRPELDAGTLRSLFVIITDVTADKERERAEASERELIALLARFARDQNGFREFASEADDLVASLASGELGQLWRAVHTLKGNCALFGAESVASQCHALESRLASGNATAAEIESVRRAWQDLRTRMRAFLGGEGQPDENLTLDRRELAALTAAVAHLRAGSELGPLLEKWLWEPAGKRLARIAEQAAALATRLHKAPIEVVVSDGGVRLEPQRWATFWASFSHVVRNAIDHGLEAPERRAQLGKPPGRLGVRTWLEGDRFQIELSDDGRGVDWAAVARKAAERGLDTSSPAALEAALFADRLSTREEVTAISGRGVGLGAVRDATHALGGSIAISSEPGRGTTFRFSFPAIGVAVLAAPAPDRSARPAA